MSNVEKLKDYLVGSKGYLLDDKLSNSKVIMLSGAWGSGKTHFWKNEIEPKFKKKSYAYVSLYGKTSISSIENDLYMQIYSSTNNEGDFISKASSTLISTYAKVFKPLSIIDAEESEKLVVASKHKKAIVALQKNALICFDDFERKSKDVDLNDLFGFITQLVLTFNCKIVLILNSDVFEGKEKEIFTTVKEKTVSKYLMFNPTCKELFEIIFDEKDRRYKKLEKYKEVLQDTFIEIGIVNARIFIQVLDNWLEWVENKDFNTDFYLRYFVLVNVNFILNHHMFIATLDEKDISETFQNEFGELTRHEPNYEDITNIEIKSNIDYGFIRSYISNTDKYNDKCIENTKKEIEIKEKDNGHDSGALLAFINRNESLIKSLHFMKCFKINEHRESNNQAEVNILNEINSFIETGIL